MPDINIRNYRSGPTPLGPKALSAVRELGHSKDMSTVSGGGKAWTLIGAVVLSLSVGVMARRATRARHPAEDLKDAVAAPMPAALPGGVRMAQPSPYFASPAESRAEAERALLSSRLTKVSKAMHSRAAKLRREAAAERALAVTAQ